MALKVSPWAQPALTLVLCSPTKVWPGGPGMGTQGFKPEKQQSCELETLPHHRLPWCSVSTQVQSRGPTQRTLTRHSVKGASTGGSRRRERLQAHENICTVPEETELEGQPSLKTSWGLALSPDLLGTLGPKSGWEGCWSST